MVSNTTNHSYKETRQKNTTSALRADGFFHVRGLLLTPWTSPAVPSLTANTREKTDPTMCIVQGNEIRCQKKVPFLGFHFVGGRKLALKYVQYKCSYIGIVNESIFLCWALQTIAYFFHTVYWNNFCCAELLRQKLIPCPSLPHFSAERFPFVVPWWMVGF